MSLQNTMMNKITPIFLFFLFSHLVKGQFYVGTSLDKFKSYNCSLKINSDSTIYFIFQTKANEMYGEHFGKIKKINDTVFHVSATMTLGKFDTKRLYSVDTLTNKISNTDYVCIDTIFAGILGSITVEYANGKTNDYTESNGECLALDKKLFSRTKGSDYYLIKTNAKDKISGNKLSFKVSWGSNPAFEKGETIDFMIVIKDDLIYSLNAYSIQTGQFTLKRNSK